MPTKALDIAIVGGELGGLASALFLDRASHSATVYESSDKLQEAGTGIVVPPNRVHTLTALGLSDSLEQFSVQIETAWEFRRWHDGQVWFSQSMGERRKQFHGAHNARPALPTLLKWVLHLQT